MSKPAALQDAEVRRCIDPNEHDPAFVGWPGDNFFDSARNGSATLRGALLAEVLARCASTKLSMVFFSRRAAGITLTNVSLMAGLFPQMEQPPCWTCSTCGGVLTPSNIAQVLRTTRWLHTAWSVANLYLESAGGERLSDDAPAIVGLSEETTCHVSPAHFAEQDPRADFVVHEAAHVFHNCKRGTIGLLQARRRECLLDIDFKRREAFAYACEAYSRITALAATTKERRGSPGHACRWSAPWDPSVDLDDYLDILEEAVSARNGWRCILQRCAPSKAGNAAMDCWRLLPMNGL